MIRRSYSTNDIVKIAKISHRQAQWLDERHLISPRVHGHRRIYSFDEAVEVAILAELRRKGLSLQKSRRIVNFMRREFARRWSDILRCGSDLYLVLDGKSVVLEERRDRIIDWLKATTSPAFLVCVSEQARRVMAYRPPD